MKGFLIVENEMAQRADRQEIVLMLQHVPEMRAKSSDCTASFAKGVHSSQVPSSPSAISGWAQWPAGPSAPLRGLR